MNGYVLQMGIVVCGSVAIIGGALLLEKAIKARLIRPACSGREHIASCDGDGPGVAPQPWQLVVNEILGERSPPRITDISYGSAVPERYALLPSYTQSQYGEIPWDHWENVGARLAFSSTG